ncbi:MAG: CDP-2,3-bis-(O-geranylgeranyl)-sn-glycerol synthase [Candidatus Bathyarchaeota archaeon]|jgi:CDP-2,3-bis-(O-geranylgeranyl)-sn-glycerol synthase
MEVTTLIIEALIFIFPAYCANAVPVIFGGGPPVDFGRSFNDGRPVLGKNKTFLGFFSGLIIGTAVGLLESVVFDYPINFGLILSLGALTGDLASSFLKRRLGLQPGDLLPVLDQIDFIIGAILFCTLFCSQILSPGMVILVLILTPPIHLLTNYIAYHLGLKNNPW